MTLAGSFLGGHGGYLAVALLTHALVGYVLGARFFDKPWAGLVGGLFADVDLLFLSSLGDPFVHRGITHTPVVAAATVVLVSRFDRPTAHAVGIGYVAQLLIDITTPKGIPLLFPLSSESISVPIGGHSPAVTVVIWIACLFVLWRHRSATDSVPATDRPRRQ